MAAGEEVAGREILLYIDMNDNTDTTVLPSYNWQLLQGQREFTINKTTEVADARHKGSGLWPRSVPLFLNWSVSGSVVKVEGDSTQARIESRWRAADKKVGFQVVYEDGSIERGWGVITNFGESAPNTDMSSKTLEIAGNSELLKLSPGS